MTIKKALQWVLFWIVMALMFNTGILVLFGKQKALEFFGGYLIELSLSVDNLFVFLLIFSSFGVEARYQRRTLNYGIAGAILMRLLFIAVGSSLVERFHWILYVFGALLIISGARMLFGQEKEKDFKDHKLVRVFSKVVPFTGTFEKEKFLIRRNGKLFATMLFAVLLVVEFSDILFAIDSIPAIFSITTDVFIVYTSNIFAILGLRSLYFMLERLYSMFRYLKFGVSVVLVFTGLKLTLPFFGLHLSENPQTEILLSIGIIIIILAVSILASVLLKQHGKDSGSQR